MGRRPMRAWESFPFRAGREGAAASPANPPARCGPDMNEVNASRPISRVLCDGLRRPTTIPLGRRSRGASSNPPERPTRRRAGGFPPRRSYSVLLPVGFALPPPLLEARWALTPPFHPYPRAEAEGGLFSVALSLGSPPPGVTRHRFSVEPGLSSPAVFRHMTGAAARPAGGRDVARAALAVKRGSA